MNTEHNAALRDVNTPLKENRGDRRPLYSVSVVQFDSQRFSIKAYSHRSQSQVVHYCHDIQ